MTAKQSAARVVLTTAGSIEEARRIGNALVEERLAACATLIPQAESIYRWEDKVETAQEILLLLKTAEEQIPRLQIRLRELHSYQTPEFLVLAVESGSAAYLAWLEASVCNG
jgi:periplasmic divalent cation tolerance protein